MNLATPIRRLYSTILAEFPWYSNALVLKPESILEHSNELPAFEVSRRKYWFILLLTLKSNTGNRYFYVRYQASRICYLVLSAIQARRTF
jgi:hypothetical protein